MNSPPPRSQFSPPICLLQLVWSLFSCLGSGPPLATTVTVAGGKRPPPAHLRLENLHRVPWLPLFQRRGPVSSGGDLWGRRGLACSPESGQPACPFTQLGQVTGKHRRDGKIEGTWDISVPGSWSSSHSVARLPSGVKSINPSHQHVTRRSPKASHVLFHTQQLHPWELGRVLDSPGSSDPHKHSDTAAASHFKGQMLAKSFIGLCDLGTVCGAPRL